MKTASRFLCLLLFLPAGTLMNAQYDLTFTVDTGTRIIDGEIPEIGHDTANDVYYLFYTLNPGGNMVATSSDGMTFGPGSPQGSNFAFYPLRTLLPGGMWRNYLYNQGMQQMESAVSGDGINFVSEPGVRYAPCDNDFNTLGVYHVYAMPDNSITMLYIGDLAGLNNTRKAVSTDTGLSFVRVETNVLGDSGVVLSNPGSSYVDVTSMSLGGSTRRLICMRGGYGIYSFTSQDYGDNYTFDNLLFTRDQASAVLGVTILGMYDPAMVLLDDGRYRIYFCANYFVDTVMTYGIFSATSEFPGSSVENETTSEGMIVYPNPVADMLYVEGIGLNSFTTRIYNIRGERVLSCTETNSKVVDVSGLSPGIYLAEIMNAEGQKFTKKFIRD